jgi:hypothetical protein
MSLFDTGLRPAVDAWLLAEAAKKRDYGDYWSGSSAGYCMRKLIFERLGVPYVEAEDAARKQRVFTAGHLFHDWIQSITKAAGLSIASEVELQDEELMVRGHFDDLVVIGGEMVATRLISGDWRKSENYEPVLSNNLILYDYKTRNSRNFNFAHSPSYFHKMQLGTYMLIIRRLQAEEVKPTWLDNLPELTEARTLNIEKDTLRMIEVQYLWSDELEKEVLDFWNKLNAHWTLKTLPPCTCGDHENGFMAKEKWNPYWYDGEPCSIKLYEKWKKDNVTK